MRTLTGIAAALTGLVGAVLHAVNTSAGRGIEPSFWLLSALGAVAFGCTGAVLARQGTVLVVPTVLALIGLGQGVSLVAREYALAGAFPLDGFALWVGSWLWAPAYLAIAALLPLLLPDGQLPSPRWRPALVLSVVALLGQAVVWAVTPYALQDVPFDVRGLTNPVGVAAAAEPVVIATAGVLTALAVLLALASVVARWRAAAGERRATAEVAGGGCRGDGAPVRHRPRAAESRRGSSWLRRRCCRSRSARRSPRCGTGSGTSTSWCRWVFATPSSR